MKHATAISLAEHILSISKTDQYGTKINWVDIKAGDVSGCPDGSDDVDVDIDVVGVTLGGQDK